jgi:hypothetical protein
LVDVHKSQFAACLWRAVDRLKSNEDRSLVTPPNKSMKRTVERSRRACRNYLPPIILVVGLLHVIGWGAFESYRWDIKHWVFEADWKTSLLTYKLLRSLLVA